MRQNANDEQKYLVVLNGKMFNMNKLFVIQPPLVLMMNGIEHHAGTHSAMFIQTCI